MRRGCMGGALVLMYLLVLVYLLVDRWLWVLLSRLGLGMWVGASCHCVMMLILMDMVIVVVARKKCGHVGCKMAHGVCL